MKHQYRNFFKTIWDSVKGMRLKFVITYAMFVVGNLILMLEPYFIGKFIDAIQQGGEHLIRNAAIYLGLLVSMEFSFWIFHGPARVMERLTAFKLAKNFSEKLFRIVTKLPLKWHKDHHSGDTIDKVNKATKALKEFTEEGYVYIESIIRVTASVFAIIVIMGWDGALVFAFGALAITIIFKFDRALTKMLTKINKREHKVASVLFDYLSNISTIITLKLEKLARREYIKRIDKIYPTYKKNTVINEIKWFIVSLIMSASAFFVLIIYIYKNFDTTGAVMVGTLVMLFEYIRRFSDVFFGIAWKYEKLVMDSTNVMAVKGILDDYETLYSKSNARQVNRKWRSIKISNLSFKYEDQKHHEHTLKDISIELARGKNIAFVGSSGSGKSTLMSILRGLTAVDTVDIDIDGKKSKDLRSLSETTTLIPQDPEIFENTIEYNITMGIPHDKRTLNRVTKMACFNEVAALLPQGFQTDIREKGVNLSGGEKQRLALARGIFAAEDSTIVLLDEPTSSVDAANELQIHKNLFTKFKKKCIVSSVHRLHLLRYFDYIYVFKKGQIIEKGTYRTLSKKGGYLTKMLKKVKTK